MTKINHIMDIPKEFVLITKKIEDMKLAIMKNSNFGYTSQDARLVALDSIQMDMAIIGMWINTLNSFKEKKK